MGCGRFKWKLKYLLKSWWSIWHFLSHNGVLSTLVACDLAIIPLM
jgi:hypothetical protein